MVAKDTDDLSNLACSFCGAPREQVETLILGPGVSICNQCVSLCAEIVFERRSITCFYCGARTYQTEQFHVDAVHTICQKCADALGKKPDRSSDRKGVCSFCKRDHQEASVIIAGREVNICAECIDCCVAMLTMGSDSPQGEDEPEPS